MVSAEIAGALEDRHDVLVAEVFRGARFFLAAMVKAELVHDGEEQSSVVDIPQTHFSGLTVGITKRCNLRCCHCYLAAGEQAKDELTFNEIRDLISAAKQLGATSINLSGREPLLREDSFRLLEHVAALGLRCTIGTNGTTVSSEVARRLGELSVTVQVSLDGASSATHDTVRGRGVFQRTMQGLDNLCRWVWLNGLCCRSH